MLEFILWVIFIYLILRIAAKYFLPLIVKYYVKRFQQKFYDQHAESEKMRKDGETNVEYTPDKKTKKHNSGENIGEYIEFEEIEKK
jgi:hypothetical protein